MYATTLISANQHGTNEQQIHHVERLSVLGAICCGLALCNQHTSLLLITILVPYVIWIMVKLRCLSIVLICKLTVSFAIGLSPYTYLVLSSLRGVTPGSWGDLTTIQGLWTHVSRSEYGTWQLGPGNIGQESMMERHLAYAQHLIGDFSLIGFSLVFVGIGVSAKCKITRGLHFTLFGSLVFYLSVWHGIFSNLPLKTNSMAAAVHSRFWMQPDILISIYSGLGMAFVLEMFTLFPLATTSINTRNTLSWTLGVLIMGLCLSPNTIFWREKFSHQNHSRRAVMQSYGHTLLKTIPNNSLLVSHSDLNWNVVRYLQVCEQYTPNVTHVMVQLMPYRWFQQRHTIWYPKVSFPALPKNGRIETNRYSEGNAEIVGNFLSANNANFKGGVFVEMQAIDERQIGAGGLWNQHNVTLVQWGFVYRVFSPPLTTLLIEKYHLKSLQLLEQVQHDFRPFLGLSFSEGSWEYAALSVFWDMNYELAISMLSHARAIVADEKRTESLLVRYMIILDRASKILWRSLHAKRSKGTLK